MVAEQAVVMFAVPAERTEGIAFEASKILPEYCAPWVLTYSLCVSDMHTVMCDAHSTMLLEEDGQAAA